MRSGDGETVTLRNAIPSRRELQCVTFSVRWLLTTSQRPSGALTLRNVTIDCAPMNETRKIGTFREIIGQWPTIAVFADDIGVKVGTAKLMRFRDSIHSDHWQAVVRAAKTRNIKGITPQLLIDLQAEKKVAA